MLFWKEKSKKIIKNQKNFFENSKKGIEKNREIHYNIRKWKEMLRNVIKNKKNSEGRRLIYDDEDKQIYGKLRDSSGIFNKFDLIDLFAIALIC